MSRDFQKLLANAALVTRSFDILSEMYWGHWITFTLLRYLTDLWHGNTFHVSHPWYRVTIHTVFCRVDVPTWIKASPTLELIWDKSNFQHLKVRYWGIHTANFMEIRLGWVLIFFLSPWHIYSTKYDKLKMSHVGHFHLGHQCPAWAIFMRDIGGLHNMKMARVGWFYAGHFVWRLSKVLENTD